ncbi:hypothetical protein F5Y15DRAFT_207448 [Xylariaceae sp. FL0016]|nr:hypothetical protein F5Y15DRAFT_207448 [Xylariaceae sp. FL0016]
MIDINLLALEHILERSSDSSCSAGSLYYKCKLNGFTGCCNFDPCNVESSDPCSEEGRGHTSDKTSATSTMTEEPFITSSTDTAEETTSSDSTSTSSVIGASTTTESASASDTSSTFSTSVVSTSDSTGGASSMVETIPAATSTAESSDGSASVGGLSSGSIAGIAVGGAFAGIALIFLLSLCVRRRHLKKRMSSTRGTSPDGFDEKSTINQTQTGSSEAKSTENDPVFGPFGGRADQPYKRKISGAKTEESWPLRRDAPHDEHAGPSQLDSTPIYVELDSAEPQRSGDSLNASPFPPSALSSHQSSPTSPSFHPSPLTPGFPGTQMSIQGQLDQARAGDRGSSNAPLGAPRATLNATMAERKNGHHATSWSNGL